MCDLQQIGLEIVQSGHALFDRPLSVTFQQNARLAVAQPHHEGIIVAGLLGGLPTFGRREHAHLHTPEVKGVPLAVPDDANPQALRIAQQ